MLKRILGISLLVCIFATLAVFWMQAYMQSRQAHRKAIYLHARRLAAEEQAQRLRDYKRQLAQQRLIREYNSQEEVVEYGQ
jgi:hypothetical protein